MPVLEEADDELRTFVLWWFDSLKRMGFDSSAGPKTQVNCCTSSMKKTWDKSRSQPNSIPSQLHRFHNPVFGVLSNRFVRACKFCFLCRNDILKL